MDDIFDEIAADPDDKEPEGNKAKKTIQEIPDTGVCGGQCCEEFTLPWSKEVIQRKAQEGYLANGTLEEIRVVADMIVPLFHGVPQDRLVTNEDWVKENVKKFLYTCKYFDRTNRKCSIYHRRPVVCRIHPGYDMVDDKGQCGNKKPDECGPCPKGVRYHKAVENFKKRVP